MVDPYVGSWFAASAVVIGAVASIFRPDNKLCPVALSPVIRGLICLVLGAVGGALQSVVGGATWQEAMSTAVMAVLAGWSWHGLASSETKGGGV